MSSLLDVETFFADRMLALFGRLWLSPAGSNSEGERSPRRKPGSFCIVLILVECSVLVSARNENDDRLSADELRRLGCSRLLHLRSRTRLVPKCRRHHQPYFFVLSLTSSI